MRQRDTGVPQGSAALPDAPPGALLPPAGDAAEPAGPAAPGDGDEGEQCLPPGQYIPRRLPVLHYGPVPTFNPATWDLRICGATRSGAEHRWNWAEFSRLERCEVVADLHCVTRFTIPGNRWGGVAAAEVLRVAPPADAVTHLMIWAEFGYSANVRIGDFAADTTLLATHLDGAPLTPEHGFPLRLVVPSLYAWKSVKWIRAIEYLTRDRRGFWEERGYHNTADPWQEQRYSYQEPETRNTETGG
jgi:DMSO/TMAO reductase YedYZ molybdopterin-dependent catalytic subunit